ncbi:MAG TPA: hypothetical protein VGI19_04990 [Candidatus Cybelea sp.]|jgi:hypothetical protein
MYRGLELVASPILAATFCVGAAFLSSAKPALAAPAVVAPFTAIYTLGTFKGVPPSGATMPDDIVVSADGTDLWVGYGNGVSTTGTDPSNLVEYDISTGMMLQNISIPGHLDGLKINPETGDPWATVNEDGNPRLNIVNPKDGKFKTFTVSSSLITGGMDDLVFVQGSKTAQAFIVASSQTDTTTPVIVAVSSKMKKNALNLTAFLPGAPPSVFNVVTNMTETTDQLGDPDSMTLNPAGEIVLDNRSDDSLYIVRNPTAPHPVLRVPLTLEDSPVEVDDTIFTFSELTGEHSTAGTIYITDTTGNMIYTLTKPYFPPNEVYSAANVANDVVLDDLNTGIVIPVVTGFAGVHGLAFSPTSVAIPPPSGK